MAHGVGERGGDVLVQAGAVPDEQMLRLVAEQRGRRAEQPQHRVDAEPASRRAVVARGPDRVGDDERAPFGPPERRLLPAREGRDPEGRERRAGHLRGRHVQRHAQPRGDRRAVAVVAVEELEHAARLAERRDARVETGEVGRVDEPDAAVGGERVRGPLHPGRLGRDPAEAGVALVADRDRGARRLHPATLATAPLRRSTGRALPSGASRRSQAYTRPGNLATEGGGDEGSGEAEEGREEAGAEDAQGAPRGEEGRQREGSGSTSERDASPSSAPSTGCAGSRKSPSVHWPAWIRMRSPCSSFRRSWSGSRARPRARTAASSRASCRRRPTPDEVARRQALTAEGIALLDDAAEPSLAGLADVRAAGGARGARRRARAAATCTRVARAVAVALEARRALGEARELAPLLRELVEPRRAVALAARRGDRALRRRGRLRPARHRLARSCAGCAPSCATAGSA